MKIGDIVKVKKRRNFLDGYIYPGTKMVVVEIGKSGLVYTKKVKRPTKYIYMFLSNEIGV